MGISCGKILSISYKPSKDFPISEGQKLDLEQLQQDCRKKGIFCKKARSVLIVNLNNCVFQVFSSGKIGICYFKEFDEIEAFNSTTFDFFWKNFVSSCVKKKELK